MNIVDPWTAQGFEAFDLMQWKSESDFTAGPLDLRFLCIVSPASMASTKHDC